MYVLHPHKYIIVAIGGTFIRMFSSWAYESPEMSISLAAGTDKPAVKKVCERSRSVFYCRNKISAVLFHLVFPDTVDLHELFLITRTDASHLPQAFVREDYVARVGEFMERVEKRK